MLFQEYGIEIRALPPTDEFFRMHRHYNSGLSDIIETIYDSTTIKHMTSVKAISRAVQRHIIVHSFLVKSIQNALLEETKTEEVELSN